MKQNFRAKIARLMQLGPKTPEIKQCFKDEGSTYKASELIVEWIQKLEPKVQHFFPYKRLPFQNMKACKVFRYIP